MGIKYLWNILNPFCEKRPLYELQGKTVAVDLSCWVCEAQNISEYQVQPKMYLRNLYFRTCYLLLMDVYPIFVLEGKAPQLKYDTITARNAIQFKGAKPKTDSVKTGKDRTRFNFVLKQCQEMLNYMGLACLTGLGEAESLCAYLNQEGFVHGCISQDSDCFAYGAQIVYRNFSISSQGSHSASGGSIDVYDIRKASSIGFGRNKIIALALLCGCDYSDGVQGIGKDISMKFFEKYSDGDILNRMRQWRANASVFDEFERKLADKNICTSCGHHGKIQAHNKTGCKFCGTSTGCDFSKYKEERLVIKNEVNIRSKALQDENFPNEVLINEFLTSKDKITKVDIKWRQPDLVKFVNFTTKHLGWDEIYSFEKCLPILTRWQLLHYSDLECLNQSHKLRGILYPEKIKKIRKPKGVPCFEIVWEDKDNNFKGLIPNSQELEIKSMEMLWSTIEPQQLVEKAYPNLVNSFKKSASKPKRPCRVVKKLNQLDELSNSLGNISINEPTTKKAKKNSPKKNRKKEHFKKELKTKELTTNVKTLNDYFRKAVENKFNNKSGLEYTSTPIKNCNSLSTIQWESSVNISKFMDDSDSNVSDVLDEIMSEKIPNCFKQKLEKMGYKISNDLESGKNDNTATFFINSYTDNDLFQRTFDEKCMSDEENIDLKDEYEDNSFEIIEKPLFERLRCKHF
ncbi:hypothetical protein WA026_020507 [Henosepilachna vigintioctopunctata]|uniref:Flap endonuclease GEN n=1 Tax=Henosepilachna vigintioctopunctata TaxID=420089 RepID=A0AAW1VH97_9CUCU